MNEEVTAVLQAHTLALSALIATHPDPAQFRRAIDTMARAIPTPHQQFLETLKSLRRAIPES